MSPLESPLILIVEDDEKSRRLMSDVLNHHGYRVLETDNAEEGINIIRRERPQLVLMDIHLPGMTGSEALRVIRADDNIKATRIMAVTASVMGSEWPKIKAEGFDAFEPKPINLKQFLASVKELAHAA